MPVFERLEDATLLSKRDENGNLSRRSAADDVLNVVVPFFGCSVSLTQKEALTQNIFIGTTVNLYNLKTKEGMETGQVVKYISDHTALDPVVIKTIIKKYLNNIDIDTHKLNTQKRSEEALILYNPITQVFYPELIDEQELKLLSQIEISTLRVIPARSEVTFSLSLQRRAEKALLLQLTESMDEDQYTSLSVPSTIPPKLINRIINRIKTQHQYAESLYIEDIKRRMPVWFLCQLYVDTDDLSDIQVISPLPRSYSHVLIDFIRETAKNNPQPNGELLNRLNHLEQVRKDALESAATFDTIKQLAYQKLLVQYPGVAQYNSVAQKVATFISRFPSEESGDTTALLSQWTPNNRKDTAVSFHSAMESIFAQACESLYPFDDNNADSTLTLMIDRFRTYRRVNVSFYSAIAQRVGFADADNISSFFVENNIRRKDVADILQKARTRTLTGKENGKQRKHVYEYDLTELIVAIMLEADAAKQHPFTEIASKCPNLFEAMEYSNDRRDLGKHHDERSENTIPSIEELYRMRSLLETCLGLLSEKVDIDVTIDTPFDNNGRNIAQIRANEDVKRYPSIAKLSGVRSELHAVCFRFHYHDAEYYSSCYNLVDSILYELLIKYDSDEDWDIIQSFFTGNSREDWNKVVALFEKYGCQYDSTIPPPSTGSMLGDNRELKPVSPRNKVAMMFAIFDQKQEELLSQITQAAPDFPLVVDRVNAERGHSNETDFGDINQLTQFHEHMLTICEKLSTFIGEDE